MNDKDLVVTRYAPSPTGYMHIGNLRTALYSYLLARHNKGKFILRIEDTDKERQVEGAEQVIYDTLKIAGLDYDEGPDKGGQNGPYVQSERKEIYLKYAQKLVDEGKAYYCFCTKEEMQANSQEFGGYNRHCRDLSAEEVQANLASGKPYVIRHKANLEGQTKYFDHIFGEIVVENSTLNDIVLIKSDGFPTYNFAHIIDDHLMGVTHVVRGNEYIISTPQYVQLHEALGFDLPEYYHLPLIMGKNADGEVSKLSKRHGAVSFADLINLGYLPEAIINYIALLGWHLGESEQEFFTLAELEQVFDASDIRKSAAIFDYEKLKWMNSKYISNLAEEEFLKYAEPYFAKLPSNIDRSKLVELLKPRIQIFSEISEKIGFFEQMPEFDLGLLINPKKKTDLDCSKVILERALVELSNLEQAEWVNDNLFAVLEKISADSGFKAMSVMWVVRLAVSGNVVTVGGATEIMQVLGKDESLRRIKLTLERI